MALQEAIQALTGSQDPVTRKEPTVTHSPQKDQVVLKGPEVQPQPRTHREAPKSGSSPKGPKESQDPLRAPEYPEEDGAHKGGPPNGAKEEPPEPCQPGLTKWLSKQGSKSQGSNLKAPQP